MRLIRDMLQILWRARWVLFIYSSKKTQITTKFNHLLLFPLYPSITFQHNPFITFWVMLLACSQTKKKNNTTENIASFVTEVKTLDNYSFVFMQYSNIHYQFVTLVLLHSTLKFPCFTQVQLVHITECQKGI